MGTKAHTISWRVGVEDSSVKDRSEQIDQYVVCSRIIRKPFLPKTFQLASSNQTLAADHLELADFQPCNDSKRGRNPSPKRTSRRL